MFIPVFALNKGSSLYQEADFVTHFCGTSPDRPLYYEPPPRGAAQQNALHFGHPATQVHIWLSHPPLCQSVILKFGKTVQGVDNFSLKKGGSIKRVETKLKGWPSSIIIYLFIYFGFGWVGEGESSKVKYNEWVYNCIQCKDGWCKVDKKVNFQPVNTGPGAHLPVVANWARPIFLALTHLYTWVERSNYG